MVHFSDVLFHYGLANVDVFYISIVYNWQTLNKTHQQFINSLVEEHKIFNLKTRYHLPNHRKQRFSEFEDFLNVSIYVSYEFKGLVKFSKTFISSMFYIITFLLFKFQLYVLDKCFYFSHIIFLLEDLQWLSIT